MIPARGEARSSTLLLVALVILSARPAAVAASAARAPNRPHVMLLAATADDPLAGRVAAELEALGLEVVRGAIDPTLPIEEQVRRAFAAGARATVVADGHRTEFWIAEDKDGSDRVALRQELEIETTPGLEAVLSLRTVEFLRVSLGLVSTPEGPASPPPPAPPVARERAESERRFSIELASGILASTGRLAPLAVIAAGLRARLLGPVGLEIVGAAPLGSDTVSAADGQVAASVWLAGGGLLFAPRPERRFSAEAGAGMMAVVVRGVGTSDVSSTTGFIDHAVGVAFYGRGAARLRLAPRWALRLDVTGGSTAVRRPVITVGGGATTPAADVTAWGTAFVAGLGGVETHF